MNEIHDHIISTISYFQIKRIIKLNQQKYIKTEHHITLYKNNILTSTNQFNLKNVYDISYKSFSGRTGLLYLHTNQGVFTYEVDSDPSCFINEYKKLKYKKGT